MAGENGNGIAAPGAPATDAAAESKGKGKAVAENVPQDTEMDEDDDDDDDEADDVSLGPRNLSLSRHPLLCLAGCGARDAWAWSISFANNCVHVSRLPRKPVSTPCLLTVDNPFFPKSHFLCSMRRGG